MDSERIPVDEQLGAQITRPRALEEVIVVDDVPVYAQAYFHKHVKNAATTVLRVDNCPFCEGTHYHQRGRPLPPGFPLAEGEMYNWGGRVPPCECHAGGGRHYTLIEHGLAGALGPRSPRVRKPPKPRAGVTITVRARIMERDGFTCRRCGHGVPDGVKLVVDHIVPVSRGGTSVDSNLQTLCRECNAGKAARDPHPQDFFHAGRPVPFEIDRV